MDFSLFVFLKGEKMPTNFDFSQQLDQQLQEKRSERARLDQFFRMVAFDSKRASKVMNSVIEDVLKKEKEKENKMIIENAKAIINGKTYMVKEIRIKHECGADPVAELTVDMHPFNQIPSGVVIHKTGGPVGNTLYSELMPKR